MLWQPLRRRQHIWGKVLTSRCKWLRSSDGASHNHSRSRNHSRNHNRNHSHDHYHWHGHSQCQGRL